MSEKIPETHAEIVTAIDDLWKSEGWTNFAGTLAAKIIEWHAAWLSAARDAEPRLRPVSETPELGDWVAMVCADGVWGATVWRGAADFAGPVTGWYLLRRAPKPPSLREMAEEIGEPGNVSHNYKLWNERQEKLEALRRAVLEREPQS